MWYAIISDDVEDSLPLRKAARGAHLERLDLLCEQGRVLVAGPHPSIDAEDPGLAGFTGSLVIVDFPDLESAITWANEDPYVKAGVYRNVSVKPFRKVLP